MKQLCLLFLVIFIMSVACEGSTGVLENPKTVKALKIGGCTSIIAILLWRLRSHNEGTRGAQVLKGEGDVVYFDLRQNCRSRLEKFLKICEKGFGDYTRCQIFPICEELICKRDETGTEEKFKDTTRENVVYFLTYKPDTQVNFVWHQIVLKKAKEHKNKNFYLIYLRNGFFSTDRPEEYGNKVVDFLDNEIGSGMGGSSMEFSSLVQNVYNSDLPIKKENIHFLTISDEVLSLDEVYKRIKR